MWDRSRRRAGNRLPFPCRLVSRGRDVTDRGVLRDRNVLVVRALEVRAVGTRLPGAGRVAIDRDQHARLAGFRPRVRANNTAMIRGLVDRLVVVVRAEPVERYQVT